MLIVVLPYPLGALVTVILLFLYSIFDFLFQSADALTRQLHGDIVRGRFFPYHNG